MFDYTQSEIESEDLKRAVFRHLGGFVFSRLKIIIVCVFALVAGAIYFGYSKLTALLSEHPNAASESTPVEEPKEIYVELSGAVTNPGVYKLSGDSRTADLLLLGGGFTNDASAQWVSQNLNLAKVLVNEQKVYVPFEWDFQEENKLTLNIVRETTKIGATSATASSDNTLPELTETDDSSTTNDTGTIDITKINVNTASQTELESLNGIGKVYAERIIANRPYANAEELQTKAEIPKSVIDKNLEVISF